MHRSFLPQLWRDLAARSGRLRPAITLALGRCRRATAELLRHLGAALAAVPSQEKGETEMNDHDGMPAPALPESQSAAGLSRQEVTSTLARAAVSIWRARRRLRKEADESQGARMALRHLDQAWSMIEALGIETRDDFEGKTYTVGNYLVESYAFEDRPGLTEDTIIEVTAPAVLIDGRLAQKCEVIVGRPPLPEEPPSPPEEAGIKAEGPLTVQEESPTTRPEPAADEDLPPAAAAAAPPAKPAAATKPAAKPKRASKPRQPSRKPPAGRAKTKRPNESDNA